MECVLCQCHLDVHESLARESDDPLIRSLENISNFEEPKGTCNVLNTLCNSDSPIEISICKECTASSLEDMKRQLAALDSECINYDKALQDLNTVSQIEDLDAMKTKLQSLTIEEKELQEELRLLEEQEATLSNEVRELNLKTIAMEEESDLLYCELRNNHRRLLECNEESHSYNLNKTMMNDCVEMLKSTSVLDVAFNITIYDSYGTINGLRLGRLPHEIVEWTEINAAFGQVALLMQILSERVSIVFTDYEILPRGNNSHVRRLSGSKPVDYPLYGSGGWKTLGQSQLDHAIVGLLHCLIQIEEKLRERHNVTTPILVYRMKGDQIIDNESPYRVKMQFNSDERWTKAMKLLLLNLKRAIALSVKLPDIRSR